MAVMPTGRFKKVHASSSAELRDWLSAHHARSENIWLVTFKKSVPDKFVSTQKFGKSAPSYRRNLLRWIKLTKAPPISEADRASC
jgi:hypothetical protein